MVQNIKLQLLKTECGSRKVDVIMSEFWSISICATIVQYCTRTQRDPHLHLLPGLVQKSSQYTANQQRIYRHIHGLNVTRCL